MYDVTQAEKDAYKQDGSVKRGYINIIPLSDTEEIITLNEYDIKDFTILDDIYTPEQGFIGSVIAKQLTLNLYKPSNIDLTDRQLEVYIGIDIPSENKTRYVPYGTFIIQKPENEQVTEKTSFEAFDFMVKFNLKFEDTLTYPCSVKDLLNAICEQCGIELATTSFVNESFVLENNQFVNGESCRDVLKAIVQISGSFAKIGRDNKLYLDFTHQENAELFAETDYTKDLKVNNVFGPVNRLVLRMSQVEGENVVIQDDEAIERDGIKELVISDNPFTYTQEKRENAIKEIWNKVKGLSYVDYDMKVIPRPYMDTGDAIILLTPNNEQYNSYLFTHELYYNGGLSGHMSATADTETETKYAFIPELANRLKHTEIKVDKANQTITSVVETQEEQNSKITQLEQNINSINASVKLIGGNNKQSNSIGAYGTKDYAQSETGTIIATEEENLKTITDNGFGRIIYIADKKWFKFTSDTLTIGDAYTLSFKYSNTINNTCLIKLINNTETVLVDTTQEKELEVIEHTFVANTEKVELYIETGAYTLGITDYYLQAGTEAGKWQPAVGETLSTVVSIYYNGIQVTSENSETITQISNLGFSVTNTNGKVLITFNKDKCILADTDINGILSQSHWKRYPQKVSAYEYLLEVYE